ncbi:15569_t:CDS:2 [Entrophospora sp. SA101]|nr:15569_t:CDS:2 [Entrophospora sp. SA101]
MRYPGDIYFEHPQNVSVMTYRGHNESNTDNDELNNLEKINAVLKKDVTHFKEREAILRKIQLYQAKISSAQYSFAGAAFEETKREKRAVEQLLQENQLVNDSKRLIFID